MRDEAQIERIQRVMGVSHVFCSTVTEMLERALSEASGGELALSQVKLLLLVGSPHRQFKVTDVAEFLGVTNAAASRAIDRLVQRGLIDRTVSKEDRRAVDLALTPESEAVLARFKEVRDRELRRVLGDHPPEALDTVASLLEELSTKMAELETVLEREGVVSRELYGPVGVEDESDEVRVAEAKAS